MMSLHNHDNLWIDRLKIVADQCAFYDRLIEELLDRRMNRDALQLVYFDGFDKYAVIEKIKSDVVATEADLPYFQIFGYNVLRVRL